MNESKRHKQRDPVRGLFVMYDRGLTQATEDTEGAEETEEHIHSSASSISSASSVSSKMSNRITGRKRHSYYLHLSPADMTPQGSKEKYTNKQKRQAEHIEKGYEKKGVSEKEAEKRAWATVNKTWGGGMKGGSGKRSHTS